MSLGYKKNAGPERVTGVILVYMCIVIYASEIFLIRATSAGVPTNAPEAPAAMPITCKHEDIMLVLLTM